MSDKGDGPSALLPAAWSPGTNRIEVLVDPEDGVDTLENE